MRHTEYVREIAKRLGCTIAQAKAHVDMGKTIIIEQMLAGNEVNISGLFKAEGVVLEAGDVEAFGKTTFQPKRIVPKIKVTDALKANVRKESILAFEAE